MTEVLEAARSVVGLLVVGEWAALGDLVVGSRVSTEQVRARLADYGGTFIMPPAGSEGLVDIVEVEGASPRTLSIRVPLWTLQEGRSDLELRLTAREARGASWSIVIDDVLVA